MAFRIAITVFFLAMWLFALDCDKTTDSPSLFVIGDSLFMAKGSDHKIPIVKADHFYGYGFLGDNRVLTKLD